MIWNIDVAYVWEDGDKEKYNIDNNDIGDVDRIVIQLLKRDDFNIYTS